MICGAHQSVAGGLHLAFSRGAADGCQAIQVFTKNSGMWKEPVLTDAQVQAFKEAHAGFGARGAREEGARAFVMAHTSYLINLATDDADILKRSIDALVSEVLRCSALGIQYCVLHPGAHLKAGEEIGLRRAAEALDEVHARTAGATARILLENTAGQGTCVGHRFEHLQAIFEGVHDKERLGVCFDTQHAFAAGYDLSTAAGYAKTWADFDAMVGLGRLRAFHLNDSKKPLGSRVDRHEHLGEGNLGLPLFWRLVNDPRFASVPGVVETEPREGETPFKQEVDLLRSLVGGPEPKPAAPVFALEVVEAAPKAKKSRR
jgi:deoxyribonuclease-4